MRKVKSPLFLDESDVNLHYLLQGILAEGQVIAMNTTLGILSLFTCEQDHPHLLVQRQFTATEQSVLVPLLNSYPYYAPYELLLASFNGGANESTVAYWRTRLQEATDAATLDMEMRPLRNALSRTRFKTRACGIEITSILETGYIMRSVSHHPGQSIAI